MNKSLEALQQLHETLKKVERTTVADVTELDIDEQAEIIAREAVAGYEPVPYRILKEIGTLNNMCESAELVEDTMGDSDAFASDEIYQQVFDHACALLDTWHDGGGETLWWPETEPESMLPDDADDPPVEDNKTKE